MTKADKKDPNEIPEHGKDLDQLIKVLTERVQKNVIVALKPEIKLAVDNSMKDLKGEFEVLKTSLSNSFRDLQNSLPKSPVANASGNINDQLKQVFGAFGNATGQQPDPNAMKNFNVEDLLKSANLGGLGNMTGGAMSLDQLSPVDALKLLMELFKMFGGMQNQNTQQMQNFTEIMYRKEVDATIRERLMNYSYMMKLANSGHIDPSMLEMYKNAQNILWNPMQNAIMTPMQPNQQPTQPQANTNAVDPNAKQ